MESIPVIQNFSGRWVVAEAKGQDEKDQEDIQIVFEKIRALIGEKPKKKRKKAQAVSRDQTIFISHTPLRFSLEDPTWGGAQGHVTSIILDGRMHAAVHANMHVLASAKQDNSGSVILDIQHSTEYRTVQVFSLETRVLMKQKVALYQSGEDKPLYELTRSIKREETEAERIAAEEVESIARKRLQTLGMGQWSWVATDPKVMSMAEQRTDSKSAGGNQKNTEENENANENDEKNVSDAVDLKGADTSDTPIWNLSGTWQVIKDRSESLDDFFKELGLSWMSRKVLLKVKVTTRIEHTKTSYKIVDSSKLGESSTSVITDGTPQTASDADGNVTQIIARQVFPSVIQVQGGSGSEWAVDEDGGGVVSETELPPELAGGSGKIIDERRLLTREIHRQTVQVERNGVCKVKCIRYFRLIESDEEKARNDQEYTDSILPRLEEWKQRAVEKQRQKDHQLQVQREERQKQVQEQLSADLEGKSGSGSTQTDGNHSHQDTQTLREIDGLLPQLGTDIKDDEISPELSVNLHPNLSGDWQLQKKQSDDLQPMLKLMGVSWLKRKAAVGFDIKTKIEHSPSRFRISDTSSVGTHTIDWYPDGQVRPVEQYGGKTHETRCYFDRLTGDVVCIIAYPAQNAELYDTRRLLDRTTLQQTLKFVKLPEGASARSSSLSRLSMSSTLYNAECKNKSKRSSSLRSSSISSNQSNYSSDNPDNKHCSTDKITISGDNDKKDNQNEDTGNDIVNDQDLGYVVCEVHRIFTKVENADQSVAGQIIEGQRLADSKLQRRRLARIKQLKQELANTQQELKQIQSKYMEHLERGGAGGGAGGGDSSNNDNSSSFTPSSSSSSSRNSSSNISNAGADQDLSHLLKQILIPLIIGMILARMMG